MPTFIGKPVTVAEDKQLQVGDTLRDFNLTATDLTKKSLSEFDGKKKVISIVPSIDTGICSTQTRTFNKELSELDDTVVITISVDLPFAQARWCGAEGLENAIMLSDYYDNSFGKDYGVWDANVEIYNSKNERLNYYYKAKIYCNLDVNDFIVLKDVNENKIYIFNFDTNQQTQDFYDLLLTKS